MGPYRWCGAVKQCFIHVFLTHIWFRFLDTCYPHCYYSQSHWLAATWHLHTLSASRTLTPRIKKSHQVKKTQMADVGWMSAPLPTPQSRTKLTHWHCLMLYDDTSHILYIQFGYLIIYSHFGIQTPSPPSSAIGLVQCYIIIFYISYIFILIYTNPTPHPPSPPPKPTKLTHWPCPMLDNICLLVFL